MTGDANAEAPRGEDARAGGAETRWDAELDARGLLCPLPVLKARKRLSGLASGAVLRVVADDPAAIVDIPHFCAEQNHGFLGDFPTAETDAQSAQPTKAARIFFIRKDG